MPRQKPKNPSKLLLNILNIPLLQLNLDLSPNLTFLRFNLATKRHHLRRWKYQCELAFRVDFWKLQEKSSMVPIIFISTPNFNPCYWAFGNGIPVAFLLCKAISIPGDQGKVKFKVSKVQKNFPFLLAPEYSHRHLTRGAPEIEGQGGNVSNYLLQQFQCCFGCNSFPCQWIKTVWYFDAGWSESTCNLGIETQFWMQV